MGLQPQLRITSSFDKAELQADQVAGRIVRGEPVGRITPAPSDLLLRQGRFTPWPGQQGTDVPGPRRQRGTVISGRVQRTGDPNYAPPMPILLEFDSSKCMLTSTMEINFKHPDQANLRLSMEKFNKLKVRILSVANKYLNDWIRIAVSNNDECHACRGKIIRVNVVAREGQSASASEVVLQSGTGRANAGRIYSGGLDLLSSLLGGVSDATIWHESGHIVLGLPDEYPPPSGDPPRPANRINTSDWSAMSTVDPFGRRAVLHPRHFSFLTAWMKRQFPECNFGLVAQPRPIVVDVVAGFSVYGTALAGFGIGEGLDIAAGFPIDKQRRFRILLGGYGNMLATLTRPDLIAFNFGALLGMDFSTNRSAGGFAVRGDIRAGGAAFTGGPGALTGQIIPDVSGILTLGYQGPQSEFGVIGGVGQLFPNANKTIRSSPMGPLDKTTIQSLQNNPYFIFGVRIGLSF